MRIDIGVMASVLAAGGLLGGLFYGGLWWTVRKSLDSPNGGLWFSASLFVRTAAALAGFYFLARGHAERLPACLAGFLVARLIATRLVGRPLRTVRVEKESRDAHHPR
jgi:F1F0 ATPase subunit 2